MSKVRTAASLFAFFVYFTASVAPAQTDYLNPNCGQYFAGEERIERLQTSRRFKSLKLNAGDAIAYSDLSGRVGPLRRNELAGVAFAFCPEMDYSVGNVNYLATPNVHASNRSSPSIAFWQEGLRLVTYGTKSEKRPYDGCYNDVGLYPNGQVVSGTLANTTELPMAIGSDLALFSEKTEVVFNSAGRVIAGVLKRDVAASLSWLQPEFAAELAPDSSLVFAAGSRIEFAENKRHGYTAVVFTFAAPVQTLAGFTFSAGTEFRFKRRSQSNIGRDLCLSGVGAEYDLSSVTSGELFKIGEIAIPKKTHVAVFTGKPFHQGFKTDWIKTIPEWLLSKISNASAGSFTVDVDSKIGSVPVPAGCEVSLKGGAVHTLKCQNKISLGGLTFEKETQVPFSSSNGEEDVDELNRLGCSITPLTLYDTSFPLGPCVRLTQELQINRVGFEKVAVKGLTAYFGSRRFVLPPADFIGPWRLDFAPIDEATKPDEEASPTYLLCDREFSREIVSVDGSYRVQVPSCSQSLFNIEGYEGPEFKMLTFNGVFYEVQLIRESSKKQPPKPAVFNLPLAGTVTTGVTLSWDTREFWTPLTPTDERLLRVEDVLSKVSANVAEAIMNIEGCNSRFNKAVKIPIRGFTPNDASKMKLNYVHPHNEDACNT
jgi:hypothetical protein